MVVHGLENNFFKIFSRKTVFNKTTCSVWMANHGVYFIESKPIFYLIFIASADSFYKSGEHINYFTRIPAVIFEYQI